jgi:hypothetical protein
MAQKKLAPELAPAIRRLNNSGSLAILLAIRRALSR